jgi:hypothetical protein
MANASDSIQVLSGLTAVLKEGWAMAKDATATEANIVLLNRVKERNDGGVDTSDPKHMKVWVPFKTVLNRRAGGVGETEAGKPAGYSTYQRAYFVPTMQDAAMGISLQTVEMAKKDQVAAVNMLDQEIRDVKLAAQKELAQQLHGDGSGGRAYLTESSSDATTSVVYPALLEVGDVVNVIDATNLTAGMLTNDDAITAISDPVWASGLPTVTVTTTDSVSGTSAAGDFFVRSNQADGTAFARAYTYYNKDWIGVAAMFNDGNPTVANYGGLDRTSATYKRWQANVATGSSSSAYPFLTTTYFRNLSIGIMESLYFQQTLAGGKLSYIVCSPAMVQEYIQMYAQTYNRTPQIVKAVDWAMEGPEFHGKPLVADPYCLPCRMYFVDESAVGRKTAWDWKPWPDESSALMPDPDKTYQFTYRMTSMGQFVTGEPWKLGLLADVREGVHASL